MQDRPTALELLDAARQFLEEQAVPALDGPRQFHARVAANVLAIVGRELRDGDDYLRAEWTRLRALVHPSDASGDPPARGDELREAVTALNVELSARVRAGDADTGAFRTAVLAHLHTTIDDKLRIANPRYLADAEAVRR
jgi:hypothetical protein